jgi:hypothetical protein
MTPRGYGGGYLTFMCQTCNSRGLDSGHRVRIMCGVGWDRSQPGNDDDHTGRSC